MCWKRDTRLAELPAYQALVFVRGGREAMRTTAHDLMREGRISGSLCLDMLAWAFDAQSIETPGYCPPAQRDEQLTQIASEDRWAMAAE